MKLAIGTVQFGLDYGITNHSGQVSIDEVKNILDYAKDKSIDTYIFVGERKKKNRLIKFDKKENPFNKLLSLNIK